MLLVLRKQYPYLYNAFSNIVFFTGITFDHVDRLNNEIHENWCSMNTDDTTVCFAFLSKELKRAFLVTFLKKVSTIFTGYKKFTIL